MSFNFGYFREVPVKTERKTSTNTLIVVGILIVLALVLLSFEDVDEMFPLTNLTFQTASSSAPVNLKGESGTDSPIAVILRSLDV